MIVKYEVGFKDVYPWVWSVMLGVALTLAEKRNAFLPPRRDSARKRFIKVSFAILVNVAAPSVLFGLTMIVLGPLYSSNMDFWEILGSLYLASVPLGAHHVWLSTCERFGWVEFEGITIERRAEIVWVTVAFLIPLIAVIFRWRIPF